MKLSEMGIGEHDRRPSRAIPLVACDICGQKGAQPIFEENGHSLVRCNHCGHFFVIPLPTEMTSGFALDGQSPPAIHKKNELSRLRIFDEYVRMVKRYISGGRWLDIGCGCGTLLATAKSNGFDAVGTEVDKRRLDYCQAASLPVIGEEITSKIFKAESFDVISLINVFSHLRCPSVTFEAITRILKSGGVILIATSECGKTAYKNEVTSWGIPGHLHFAGPKTFKMLAVRFSLNVFYVKRELSQKVILCEKLAYDSERPLIQGLKFIFRRFPRLTEFAPRIICLKRGYRHPRQEVVVILQKVCRQKAGLELIRGQ